MFRKHLYLYLLMLLVLIHMQFNVHSFGLFVLASAFTGLLPIPGMKWYKYALVELVALGICLALQFPQAKVLETVGSIIGTGGPGLVVATVVVSTITHTLTAWTVYVWVTRFVFEKRLKSA